MILVYRKKTYLINNFKKLSMQSQMYSIVVCFVLNWSTEKGQDADKRRFQRAQHYRGLEIQV
jgi:hypothetical protein